MNSHSHTDVWFFGVMGLALVLAGMAGPAQAEFLTNGDFEATPFDTGWTQAGSVPAVVHQGLTPTGLDAVGTQAAWITKGVYPAGAKIRQMVTGASSWTLDFLIASEDPGAAATYSMELYLGNNPPLGMISLRLKGDGTMDVYDQGAAGYVNIGGSFTFSVDGNSDGDFEDGVGVDTLNVHSMRFVGDYTRTTPSYDVYLSAANSPTPILFAANVPHFHTADPISSTKMYKVEFRGLGSEGNYVVDQVSLVPEPSTLVLLCLGSLTALALYCAQRRRQRRC